MSFVKKPCVFLILVLSGLTQLANAEQVEKP